MHMGGPSEIDVSVIMSYTVCVLIRGINFATHQRTVLTPINIARMGGMSWSLNKESNPVLLLTRQ